ncbi:hypothetical protein SacmaDRAFT_2867 [Saccharomonospora marina XMU15]|uniref:Uncharacterized protein n=2 Tax=Saccharomonospora TaxID=1851 RepID=H5X4M9_9PSEU|nr:hypothetical protein SacmaDRAFT_2867 [Saccharomonospora marina XMU15]
MLALREALDEIVGANVLIETALRALLDGVDSPSLRLLAGLSRKEEADAHDLFRAVATELELTPAAPADIPGTRWQLVRMLCEAIAEGSMEPAVAADLIWHHGWNELGYPDTLQPLACRVIQHDDWNPSCGVERDRFRRLIIDEAKRLIDGPWPPA